MNHRLITASAILVALLACWGMENALATQYQVLHSFTGGASDGSSPMGTLDSDGTILYGASSEGGASGFGAVYSMNRNGTGFAVVTSLPRPGVNANEPLGGVSLVGSTLYATSFNGNSSPGAGNGTLFSVNTNGSSLQVVHGFGTLEGGKPDTPLFRSGTTVYGTAPQSLEDTHRGSVFSYDSSGYHIVHTFVPADGSRPENVSIIGSKLYGSTSTKIFSVNTDGTNFQVLAPATAAGPLMAIGSTVYGLHSPSSGAQTLFAMNLDGTGEHTLHTFTGGATDGRLPLGNLVVYDGSIYGISSTGGTSNRGTVWKVNPDGTGFQIVHSFLGGATDGSSPTGGLLLVGSTLYGQTTSGGTGSAGTIFALTVPEPSSLVLGLLGVSGLACVAIRRRSTRTIR